MCTAKYSQHYRKSTIQNPKKDPASSIQRVKISNSRLQLSEKNSRLIVSHQKKSKLITRKRACSHLRTPTRRRIRSRHRTLHRIKQKEKNSTNQIRSEKSERATSRSDLGAWKDGTLVRSPIPIPGPVNVLTTMAPSLPLLPPGLMDEREEAEEKSEPDLRFTPDSSGEHEVTSARHRSDRIGLHWLIGFPVAFRPGSPSWRNNKQKKAGPASN